MNEQDLDNQDGVDATLGVVSNSEDNGATEEAAAVTQGDVAHYEETVHARHEVQQQVVDDDVTIEEKAESSGRAVHSREICDDEDNQADGHSPSPPKSAWSDSSEDSPATSPSGAQQGAEDEFGLWSNEDVVREPPPRPATVLRPSDIEYRSDSQRNPQPTLEQVRQDALKKAQTISEASHGPPIADGRRPPRPFWGEQEDKFDPIGRLHRPRRTYQAAPAPDLDARRKDPRGGRSALDVVTEISGLDAPDVNAVDAPSPHRPNGDQLRKGGIGEEEEHLDASLDSNIYSDSEYSDDEEGGDRSNTASSRDNEETTSGESEQSERESSESEESYDDPEEVECYLLKHPSDDEQGLGDVSDDEQEIYGPDALAKYKSDRIHDRLQSETTSAGVEGPVKSQSEAERPSKSARTAGPEQNSRLIEIYAPQTQDASETPGSVIEQETEAIRSEHMATQICDRINAQSTHADRSDDAAFGTLQRKDAHGEDVHQGKGVVAKASSQSNVPQGDSKVITTDALPAFLGNTFNLEPTRWQEPEIDLDRPSTPEPFEQPSRPDSPITVFYDFNVNPNSSYLSDAEEFDDLMSQTSPLAVGSLQYRHGDRIPQTPTSADILEEVTGLCTEAGVRKMKRLIELAKTPVMRNPQRALEMKRQLLLFFRSVDDSRVARLGEDPALVQERIQNAFRSVAAHHYRSEREEARRQRDDAQRLRDSAIQSADEWEQYANDNIRRNEKLQNTSDQWKTYAREMEAGYYELRERLLHMERENENVEAASRKSLEELDDQLEESKTAKETAESRVDRSENVYQGTATYWDTAKGRENNPPQECVCPLVEGMVAEDCANRYYSASNPTNLSLVDGEQFASTEQRRDPPRQNDAELQTHALRTEDADWTEDKVLALTRHVEIPNKSTSQASENSEGARNADASDCEHSSESTGEKVASLKSKLLVCREHCQKMQKTLDDFDSEKEKLQGKLQECDVHGQGLETVDCHLTADVADFNKKLAELDAKYSEAIDEITRLEPDTGISSSPKGQSDSSKFDKDRMGDDETADLHAEIERLRVENGRLTADNNKLTDGKARLATADDQQQLTKNRADDIVTTELEMLRQDNDNLRTAKEALERKKFKLADENIRYNEMLNFAVQYNEQISQATAQLPTTTTTAAEPKRKHERHTARPPLTVRTSSLPPKPTSPSNVNDNAPHALPAFTADSLLRRAAVATPRTPAPLERIDWATMPRRWRERERRIQNTTAFWERKQKILAMIRERGEREMRERMDAWADADVGTNVAVGA